jgi:hypothetical protein
MKFTEQQRADIAKRYSAGESLTVLAKDYAVSRGGVYNLVESMGIGRKKGGAVEATATPRVKSDPVVKPAVRVLQPTLASLVAQFQRPETPVVDVDMRTMFWGRHRGPFQLQVLRTTASTKAKFAQASAALPGRTDGPDALSEARALLTDPRDTIVSVSIWSVPESQHVMTINKKNVDSFAKVV